MWAVNLPAVDLQPSIHTFRPATVAHGRLTAARVYMCVFVLKVTLSMLLCATLKSLGFRGNNLGEMCMRVTGRARVVS